MTDSTTIYPTPEALPRFSWRRMLQLATLYRHALRTQWTIYAIAIPAIYLAMVFLPQWLSSIFTLTIALLTMGAPLAFCRHGDNTLVRLAPVTGAERLTFYLLYTFIIVPVGLELYFQLIQAAGTLISPAGHVLPASYDFVARAASADLPLKQCVILTAGSCGISILVIGTILYGALCGRNPVKAAILYGAGTYTALMVVIVIYSAILGFIAAKETGIDSGDAEKFASDFMGLMPGMMLVIGIVSIALFIILCVKLYRRLR